jgi:hypothetical protein
VETDRLASGVVVQPDALAEQDRDDVQVDLVDQAQFEQLIRLASSSCPACW